MGKTPLLKQSCLLQNIDCEVVVVNLLTMNTLTMNLLISNLLRANPANLAGINGCSRESWGVLGAFELRTSE